MEAGNELHQILCLLLHFMSCRLIGALYVYLHLLDTAADNNVLDSSRDSFKNTAARRLMSPYVTLICRTVSEHALYQSSNYLPATLSQLLHASDNFEDTYCTCDSNI
jgi:hypothetical protein